MKRLPKVATEMALHVLAYNLTRVNARGHRFGKRHGNADFVASEDFLAGARAAVRLRPAISFSDLRVGFVAATS